MPTADLLPDVQIKRAAEQGIDFARVSPGRREKRGRNWLLRAPTPIAPHEHADGVERAMMLEVVIYGVALLWLTALVPAATVTCLKGQWLLFGLGG